MASFKFLQLAKGNSIFFPQIEYTRKNIPQKKRSFESYIQGIEKIYKHGKIRGFSRLLIRGTINVGSISKIRKPLFCQFFYDNSTKFDERK